MMIRVTVEEMVSALLATCDINNHIYHICNEVDLVKV